MSRQLWWHNTVLYYNTVLLTILYCAHNTVLLKEVINNTGTIQLKIVPVIQQNVTFLPK